MQTWNDLLFVKQVNRGADDVWTAYHVSYGSDGEMLLEEYGRFAVDYYGNMKMLPLKNQEAKIEWGGGVKVTCDSLVNTLPL